MFTAVAAAVGPVTVALGLAPAAIAAIGWPITLVVLGIYMVEDYGRVDRDEMLGTEVVAQLTESVVVLTRFPEFLKRAFVSEGKNRVAVILVKRQGRKTFRQSEDFTPTTCTGLSQPVAVARWRRACCRGLREAQNAVFTRIFRQPEMTQSTSVTTGRIENGLARAIEQGRVATAMDMSRGMGGDVTAPSLGFLVAPQL